MIVKSKKSVLSNVVFDQKCKQNQEHIKLHLKRIYAFLNDQKHFRKTYQQVNRRNQELYRDQLTGIKKLPKKFRINNFLVDVTYSLQTKMMVSDEQDTIKLLKEKIVAGREGFFCLKSSENLTLKQALQTYRKKDSIEKIINSLKNEIVINHYEYGQMLVYMVR